MTITESTLKQYLEATDFYSLVSFDTDIVRSNPLLEDYRKALRDEAEILKTEPLCELSFHDYKQYDTTGNRLSYEKPYFYRRHCLGIFALMAWLYNDKTCLSFVEDYLWAICNEYTWALPAHLNGHSLDEKVEPFLLDLFATETAQTLSEICFLLKDKLHPAVLYRCNTEIERRIFSPFMARTSPYWWESCHINWAAVCGGAIGMAAIYMMKDDERLSSLLIQIFPVMEHFLSGFEEDGTCLEGLIYWTYGMSYFTAFSDLLFQRSGGRIDLLSQPKVKNIAAFQGKCYFEGGHTVSFSDASSTDTFRIGITSYLADYFNYELPELPARSAARFGSDPCARWCQLFRDFIWTQPRKRTGDGAVNPKTCILPDAKWLIFHGTDVCGAIKGGHNDEPHNHNDVGSFFLLFCGKELLLDLGAGEYTKDSFSDQRYTIFTNQSLSHNVPVIDGEGQKAGRKYCAHNYYFSDGQNTYPAGISRDGNQKAITASMDIAPAYGNENLISLMRSLIFDDQRRTMILCDRYIFKKSISTVEERFITRQKPVIEMDNNDITKREEAKKEDTLTGKIILYNENQEPCNLYYDKELLTASLSTDIHKNHENGAEETIYLLCLKLIKPSENPIITITLSW